MSDTETPSTSTYKIDIDEIHANLPVGFKAKIKTDPVVAFMHTRQKCEDSDDKQMIHIYPLTPNTGGGFNEIIDSEEEIISVTPSPGVGKMYSMYIDGPNFHRRETLGYEYYLGQSPVNWQKRALRFCKMISIANDFRNSGDEEPDKVEIRKLSGQIMNVATGETEEITDPEMIEKLSLAVKGFLSEKKKKGEMGRKGKIQKKGKGEGNESDKSYV